MQLQYHIKEVPAAHVHLYTCMHDFPDYAAMHVILHDLGANLCLFHTIFSLSVDIHYLFVRVMMFFSIDKQGLTGSKTTPESTCLYCSINFYGGGEGAQHNSCPGVGGGGGGGGRGGSANNNFTLYQIGQI